MAAPSARLRPDVSLPGLLSTVRGAFGKVVDSRRQASVQFSMPDTLMAGLAIFTLKYPSLLMFDQHARTGVLSLDFEPITRSDGSQKNDCERNAGKRLMDSIAEHYPKRRFVVIEDALGDDGPHLKALLEHGMHFITVARPGSNAALFETLDQRMRLGQQQAWETLDETTQLLRGYRITERVALNDSHPDLLVNCLEYYEVDKNGHERNWQWISDVQITSEYAEYIMRAAARARRSRMKLSMWQRTRAIIWNIHTGMASSSTPACLVD